MIKWYVPCGCDHHGDHLGCDHTCKDYSGSCQHPLGWDVYCDCGAEETGRPHRYNCYSLKVIYKGKVEEMARTKDPLRHAGLAEGQVAEALRLVNNELVKVKDQIDELTDKRNDLQTRSDTLTGALRALQA